MYIDVYFEEVKKVLEKIEKTQKAAIEECAKIIANSLVNGGLGIFKIRGICLSTKRSTVPAGLWRLSL